MGAVCSIVSLSAKDAFFFHKNNRSGVTGPYFFLPPRHLSAFCFAQAGWAVALPVWRNVG